MARKSRSRSRSRSKSRPSKKRVSAVKPCKKAGWVRSRKTRRCHVKKSLKARTVSKKLPHASTAAELGKSGRAALKTQYANLQEALTARGRQEGGKRKSKKSSRRRRRSSKKRSRSRRRSSNKSSGRRHH
jgi:hypothetical protein